MKRLLTVMIIIGFVIKAESQTNLDNYKYVVIPLQYEFFKGKDTYRLNTLTRVLFKEAGFETYFNEEQLPEDLFKDRCLALYPDVKKVKGRVLRKNVQILIKDCKGNVIFESEVGDSKENNHQKAYNEALRKAFKSIEKLNYNYKPQSNTVEEIKTEKNDTARVEETSEIVEDELIKIEDKKPIEIIEAKTETKEESASTVKKEEELKFVKQEDLHQERYPSMEITQSKLPTVYLAKKVDKGYEIYSSSFSTYQFTMYSTIINEVYIFQNKDISGSIIKRENGNWILESIKDGKYSIEKINLTFQ